LRRLPNFKSKHYLFLIIALIILAFLPLRSIVRRSLFFITDTIGDYRTRPSLIEQIQREKLFLSLQLERLKGLEEENVKLRKALELADKKGIRLVIGEIISFSPTSWQRRIFIDVGANDGVREGMIVIDTEQNVVGKVIETTTTTAEVMLVEDPSFNAVVLINEYMGLVRGSLSGGATLRYVDASDEVKEGDIAYLRHATEHFSLPVGTVREVSKDKNSLFLYVKLETAYNIHSLKSVFVLQ